MFGYANNLGVDKLDGSETCPEDPTNAMSPVLPITPNAPDVTEPDPPHEFDDVRFQVTGAPNGSYSPPQPFPMNGFAASAKWGLLTEQRGTNQRLASARGKGEYALQCQGASQIKILRELAREYAVCQYSYASMPGPTWPNRFFVHAASSGGLDNSPSDLRSAAAVTLSRFCFQFENGTIYDRIGRDNWRIYHCDYLPQIFAVQSMVERRFGFFSDWKTHFRDFEQFGADLDEDPFKPQFVFIEPHHGIPKKGKRNSQHPDGTVSAGEILIKRVYEYIRNSRLWENSVLIITYDEHGGFFDRECPISAITPGDAPLNRHKAEFPKAFDFTLTGPRVPTVVISPWIDPGTVEKHNVYDHTSILKTVEDAFAMAPLTNRDRAATGFGHLLTRTSPRTGADEAPETLPPVDQSTDVTERSDDLPPDEEELSPHEVGVLRIAMTVDHLLRSQEAGAARRLFDPLIAGVFPQLAITPVPPLPTPRAARDYIATVEARVAALESVLIG